MQMTGRGTALPVLPAVVMGLLAVAIPQGLSAQVGEAGRTESAPAGEVVGEAQPSEEDIQKAIQEQMEARRREIQKQISEDPDWRASHEEVLIIKVSDGPRRVEVHNFCLSQDGFLLVGCGGRRIEYIRRPDADWYDVRIIDEPGEIRIYSQDGERIGTWKMDVKPEALCVHPDGTIFVGGDGKVARLNPDGSIIARAPSPVLSETAGRSEKGPSGPQAPEDAPGLNPEQQQKQAAAQARAMEFHRGTVTGIAVTSRDLFVACPEVEGYGFAVYRMDHELKSPVKIVSRLRGCCGQMDIQARSGELWVAENARHRVIRYDRDGKELSVFGRTERKKPNGFGGCCEPKNLRFGVDGELYAAESGPPVAVKRFTPDGKFLGVAGVADFYTGCVRVTVEVTADAQRIFVLNSDESSIHVLEHKVARPTHEQVATIEIPVGDKPAEIHTLCVDAAGNLLAACGGERLEYSTGPDGMEIRTAKEPSGIRVISPDGKSVTTWPLEITPQAINVAPDGTVFAAGQGKVAKLDREGKVIISADSPHVSEMPPLPPVPDESGPAAEESDDTRKAKQAKIDELERRIATVRDGLNEAYRPVEEAEKAGKSNPEASAKLEKIIAEYQEIMDQLHELTTSPRQLAMERRAAAIEARMVTGIAITDEDVFVACPAVKGYGYDVWRLDRELKQPKKIVERLSGCCGQMDIQARDGKLYVAENGRHRVVCYDREGKQLCAWGQTDRVGVKGFGSCCNPMNIRFGSDGNVYTSESNLGRVKRYSPNGDFLGVVGVASIIPGCKHVAVGLDKGGNRVYLLDITRKQIIVMARQPAAQGIRKTIVREF